MQFTTEIIGHIKAYLRDLLAEAFGQINKKTKTLDDITTR